MYIYIYLFIHSRTDATSVLTDTANIPAGKTNAPTDATKLLLAIYNCVHFI